MMNIHQSNLAIRGALNEGPRSPAEISRVVGMSTDLVVKVLQNGEAYRIFEREMQVMGKGVSPTGRWRKGEGRP